MSSDKSKEQLINELKKEKNRIQKYLDIIGVIIVAIDTDKKITFINTKCCEILGYNEEEVIGKNWFDTFIPERFRAEVEAIYTKLMAGRFELNEYFESPVLIRGGKERLIAWHSTVLQDETGKIIGALSSGEDITEYRQAEAQLKESEERYKNLIELTTDIVYISDVEGNLMFQNCAGYRILEAAPEEVIGQPWVKWIYPDDRERTIKRFKEMIEHGIDVFDFECRHISKSGRIIYGLHNVRVLRTEKGEIIGIQGIARDITERKRAEDLSRALNNINFIINSTLDFDEIMQRVVVEAAKAIGCDSSAILLHKDDYWVAKYVYGLPQETIGMKFAGEQSQISMFTAKIKKPIFIKNAYSDERIRANHQIVRKYGIRSILTDPLFVRGDVIGILLFVYLSVKPILSHTENDFAEKLSVSVSLALENANLCTKLKHVAQESERRSDELARSNSELEQFAYVASHDLQEPLRMISGFAQLLAKRYKGKLDKNADEFIAFIVDGTIHMQRMIEDLLAYSRVGTRGKPFEPTNLEDIFNQAIVNLKTAIEQNAAVITHDPLPTVMADITQMIQLFQNLIANAIKFRKKEEPPHISISAKREKNEWLFSVKDNGIGIAPEFIGHIFQLFQREHAVSEYPGTGIGLAICKRIVERHGGRIWAESEPEKGSIFYFTISVRNKN